MASQPSLAPLPPAPVLLQGREMQLQTRQQAKHSVSDPKRTEKREMSWRPQYRSSKFRNVYGKVANREHCFDGIPITKNVHDNHFCAVNAKFLAIVTESAGGGSFLVIPLEQTGRIEPNHPKVCGHQGNVLDIKWSPFIENIIASCSEDTSVRIWEIPDGGLKRNLTDAVLELYGHSRRVGLVEWHPTANNVLFSAGYDYKVLIWNLDIGEPVKMIDCHTDVILCMSFNTDGSLLSTTCKDKKLRVIEPRSGRVLQEASCKNHRVNRVVFLGNTKRLLTTGVSRWNTRQIALWDQEDLSMPLIEEEIDGLSGLLFPFYDADTHMLYLAGKGDGNIRYYEISSEKPYLNYLMEFRSPAPQKGLGVMPKHGLDVSACEVFRFYKLVTLKGLIEPISMIVPRRVSTSVQIGTLARGPELSALTPCLRASSDSGAGVTAFLLPSCIKEVWVLHFERLPGESRGDSIAHPETVQGARLSCAWIRGIRVEMLAIQWVTNGPWPAVYSKRNTLGVILLPTISVLAALNLLAISLAHNLVSQACFFPGCG
uniref:Coronin n=1 Tax=Crocodylus porosus TaxID=8502 RepID=A0A7M4DXC7_CROPO